MLTLILGATLGAIVLGIVGRVAMVGVALITENDVNLSLKGVLVVILLGTLLGAVGGLVLLPLRKMLLGGNAFRGILLGFILFGFSLAAAPVSIGMAFDPRSAGGLTLAIVAIVYVIYGITLDAIVSWFHDGVKRTDG